MKTTSTMSALILVLEIVCVIPLPASAASCSSLQELEWLTGQWSVRRNAHIIRESWHRVSENTFEGRGETLSRTSKRKTSEESLRLVSMSGRIFFIAKVKENPFPVPFALVECADERLVFENTAHDFPQRLVYQLKNSGKLLVTVSAEKDAGFEILFKRESGQELP